MHLLPVSIECRGWSFRTAPESDAHYPHLPNLDLTARSEPSSDLEKEVGDQMPDPKLGLAQETAEAPPGPLSVSLTQGPNPDLAIPTPTPSPLPGHRRTRDQKWWGGVEGGDRRVVLALVTFQCHMQMERRHGLPGVQQPIQRRERSPSSSQRRQTKTPVQGAWGVSQGTGSPWDQSGSGLTLEPG